MKTIIVIQTLIIVAGAYYIYLITQPPVEVVAEPAVQAAPVPPAEGEVREGYTPPTSNPPIDPATDSSAVSGPSDVGMEYPTPDAELQAQ